MLFMIKRPPENKINQFQLALLLDDKEKQFYNYVIANNIYCSQCRGIASEGIVVDEIFLTDLNDIRVRGRCKVCNGEVGRLFEYGENKDFYDKVSLFRNSIKK